MLLQRKKTVDSSGSADVKEREDNNCVLHNTQKQRVKQKQRYARSEEYSTVVEEDYSAETLTTDYKIDIL